MKLCTRVRLPWYASAIRSNIRFRCSSKFSDVAPGTSGSCSFATSPCAAVLHAPLDLAHALQVVARAWRGPARPSVRFSDAASPEIMSSRLLVCCARKLPLFRRIALPEQPQEQLARIALHRQRRRGRAERKRAGVAAAVAALAGAARRHAPARWRFRATATACPARCAERRSGPPWPPCAARALPADARTTARSPAPAHAPRGSRRACCRGCSRR